MKKIICLTDCLGPGGAQRQMVGLAKLLQDAGYQVEVITYHDLPFYKEFLDKNNITNTCTPPTKTLVMRLFYLRQIIIKSSPDVLITYQETPSLLGCFLKIMIPKLKVIVSERNTTQRIGKMERIRFFLYRWSNYVVANSHTQGDFIRKHYSKLRNKVEVITNFVDCDFFTPSKEKPNSPPIICAVASEKKEKNFHYFTDAIKILKELGLKFKVEWWGINNTFINKFREEVRSKGIDDIMNVNPPQKEILRIYQKSDIFCLPSLFEGFPNVLCEAMSCGLPIVASNVCDNPHIVENGVNGFLFNPLSPQDIAKKLENILKLNQHELNKMKDINRRKAVTMFSKKEFTSKYIKLIEN